MASEGALDAYLGRGHPGALGGWGAKGPFEEMRGGLI